MSRRGRKFFSNCPRRIVYNDSMNEALGRRIRHAREAVGWTQARLASKLKVRAGTLSSWENGQTAPPLDAVNLMAQLLSISCCELAGHRCTPQDMLRQLMHASETNAAHIKGYTLSFSFNVGEVEEE